MNAPIKTEAARLADAQRIIKEKNAEIRELERTNKQLQKDEDTAEKVREFIFEIARRDPRPPQWLIRPTHKPNAVRGVPAAIWSDWHYGERINPKEIGGVNEFNADIAKRRARRLTERTIDLCFHHMGRSNQRYPGLVLGLGGDMVGGAIHEELLATNDRTPQQAVDDLTDILAAGIDNLAVRFGNLFIPGVVGNHGRSTHKPRMKQRVHTNLDWLLYCNLNRHFKKEKHIQFLIPEEADAHFKIYHHRYLFTHGDALGVKGGDGIIGSIGPIMRGALKISRSSAAIGLDFDTAIICHWHQYIPLPKIIVNNSFKGFDEFAHLALRAEPSTPSQALWLTHPEWGITNHWQVFLEGKRHFAKPAPWVSWPQG